MSYEGYGIETTNISSHQEISRCSEDYSTILKRFELDYKHVEHHLLIGEIVQVQGWILHISVIKSQISKLLNTIIPELIANQVPFKIVKDKETARSLLDGEFGQSQVGKVVSIYPGSIEHGISLVKLLLPLTAAFKGPQVLTDIHLGGVIYTRYGSFSPIIRSDAAGKRGKFIYDSQNQLTLDTYNIPFILPSGIDWPFFEFASPISLPPKKILHQIYKPIAILKSDAKGNVIKSLYLKNNFFVKWCVIKKGKKNMWSDDVGRDITDRLSWQKHLHEKLADTIPLPKILDFFKEDDDTHLAMEFIKGPSLFACITTLNSKCHNWTQLPLKSQIFTLDRLIELTHIIERTHKKGFVHRDITPVNFLVDKKHHLYLIDIELAYSLFEQIPNPPFEFGTNGFMAPEQMEVRTPTIKEDIYGLGATILTLLVGIPPINFKTADKKLLLDNLSFFIKDTEIAEMIASCLYPDPFMRPQIKDINFTLQQFKDSLSKNEKAVKHVPFTGATNDQNLKALINASIKGLVTPPTVINRDLWQSRVPSKDNIPDSQKIEFGKSAGLFEGISGVLYFLGRAKTAGFDINPCQNAYKTGWDYLRNNYLEQFTNIAPGLYGGAAGIALAILSGMNSGLIEDNKENRLSLKQCLELPPIGLDIATGAAGQGIVAMQSSHYLEKDVLQQILQKHIELLLASRQKNGYWLILQDSTGRKSPAASFAYGNSGIIWFLLDYAKRYNDNTIQKVATLALSALTKLVLPFIRLIKNKGFRKILDNPQTWDGIPGVILILLKAYETQENPLYKQMAEKMLKYYPSQLVHENFSQDVGLSGMGELYLEAFRVFKNEEWQVRANWLAEFFAHTSRKESDGNYHWLNNNSVFPTADFMVGNSGIIHFLIRCQSQNKLGYRLLG